MIGMGGMWASKWRSGWTWTKHCRDQIFGRFTFVIESVQLLFVLEEGYSAVAVPM